MSKFIGTIEIDSLLLGLSDRISISCQKAGLLKIFSDSKGALYICLNNETILDEREPHA
jgi:hypothetical protein